MVNVPMLRLAARRDAVGFLDVVHLDLKAGKQPVQRRRVVDHDVTAAGPAIAFAQKLTREPPARLQRTDNFPPQRLERARLGEK